MVGYFSFLYLSVMLLQPVQMPGWIRIIFFLNTEQNSHGDFQSLILRKGQYLINKLCHILNIRNP